MNFWKLLDIFFCVAIGIIAILLFTSPSRADWWVQGQVGPTWYQSDHNSNHYAYAQSIEIGHDFKWLPLSVVTGYAQSENNDHGMSQKTGTEEYQHVNYDFDYRAFTVWLMPRIRYGNFVLSAGPGVGGVYSTLDLTTEHGENDSSSGWQDNVSLRADLHYHFNQNFAVGFTYRHDYFEVQLEDRDVSDYEVNQDRVYYLANFKFTF